MAQWATIKNESDMEQVMRIATKGLNEAAFDMRDIRDGFQDKALFKAIAHNLRTIADNMERMSK
jgi:hypothetical protein